MSAAGGPPEAVRVWPWPLELHALRQHLQLDHGVTTDEAHGFDHPSPKVLDHFHRQESHGPAVGHEHSEAR